MEAVGKHTGSNTSISPSQPPPTKRNNEEMMFSPEANTAAPPASSLSDTLQSALNIPVPEGTDPFLGGMLKTLVAAQGITAKTAESSEQSAKACVERVNAQEKRLTDAENHLDDVDQLMKTMYGRMLRMEIEHKREKESKADILARSMGNNLVFQTEKSLTEYQETAGENTEHKIRLFLTKKLSIPADTVNKIYITHSHRMGVATEKLNKPMIAKIPSHKQRSLILSNTKALEKTKNSVYIQTPPQYNERKQFSWKAFKAAKKAKKSAGYRNGHILYVDNKPVTRYLPVPIPPCGSDILGIERDKLASANSDSLERDGHCFQARVVSVTSTQDVRDALDESLREGFSAAEYLSYAFRIADTDMQGGNLEDFESGGNPYAGIHILQHLQTHDLTNALVLVSQTSIPDTPPLKTKDRNSFITTVIKSAIDTLTSDTDDEESQSDDNERG